MSGSCVASNVSCSKQQHLQERHRAEEVPTQAGFQAASICTAIEASPRGSAEREHNPGVGERRAQETQKAGEGRLCGFFGNKEGTAQAGDAEACGCVEAGGAVRWRDGGLWWSVMRCHIRMVYLERVGGVDAFVI